MQPFEIAFALVLGLVFAPTAAGLASAWASVDYQSHGFLVPVVSALVASSLARHQRGLARRRDGRGAAVLAAALALYATGLGIGSLALQGLALVAALAAAVWFLRGLAWLRALAFPIAYLLFMVPIPPEWLAPVIVRLSMFVSSSAVDLLGAFGVPIAREGNVIVLPGGESLFVAEACSGLTSLVTLTPIAVLIAWIAPLSLRAKLLVVALAVPIAMATNLLRVIGTVLGARRWGVGAVTDDPVHTLLGLAVYALGAVALLASARGLARLAAPAGRMRTAAR